VNLTCCAAEDGALNAILGSAQATPGVKTQAGYAIVGLLFVLYNPFLDGESGNDPE